MLLITIPRLPSTGDDVEDLQSNHRLETKEENNLRKEKKCVRSGPNALVARALGGGAQLLELAIPLAQ